MSNEVEPDFLTDTDVQERVEAFRAGPRTLDRAAGCGFCALSVPTRFGGLYVQAKKRKAVLRTEVVGGGVLPTLYRHDRVCRAVYRHGTPVQHDLFLPQLAAGKAIGTWVGYSIGGSLGEGFPVVTGMFTLPVMPDAHRHFAFAMGLIDGRYCYLLMPLSQLLPRLTRVPWPPSRRSSPQYELRWCELPHESLLGHQADVPTTTEKWEAIRWNTDRSAS